ncbi:hypothetical protein [Xanthobacter sediminis]|uniref:hypothetical protein n=1 Tax=Xanthobacter sediminis TaxID=3119926 RepID=UPI00372754E8
MLKHLIVAASLLAATPALAQTNATEGGHAHGARNGPHGGPMEDIAGVHAELEVSGKTLTVHVLDAAGKGVDTTGFAGSAMLVLGGARQTLTLKPSGETLVGEAGAPIAPGTAVTLLIKTAAGKSGQAKFTTH